MTNGFSCVGRSLTVTARNYPCKRALVAEDGRSLTFDQLNRASNQFAHFLLGKGIRKGDHVALLLPNAIEHVCSLYAIAKIGAVVIALEPRWTNIEIERTLVFFDCKVLIVNDAWSGKLTRAATDALPCGVLPVTLNGGSRHALDELISDYSEDEPSVDVHDDDIYTLLLTSGTTGMPKGCIRSHRNVEVGCIKDSLGRRQDERSQELVVAPMHYGSGRGSVLGQIYIGGTVHFMESFDANRVAAYIQREKITDIALAPTMCTRLLSLPDLDRYDFSSLKALRKVGSPFHTSMTKQLMEKVTHNLFQGFASTESGGATMLRPHEQSSKPGSSGRPRWGVEVAIVDQQSRSVRSFGEEGEIRIRSANVCQGYYKNPEEQRNVFNEGWYYTGDLGFIDEDGYLYVKGRLKDLIKTGSINVAPREVESTIMMIDGVHDVAVIGVPDPEWGEAIKAFVVRNDGSRVSVEDIVSGCRTTLAGFKVPKYVAFIEAIERNALGKVTAEFKAAAVAGTI